MGVLGVPAAAVWSDNRHRTRSSHATRERASPCSPLLSAARWTPLPNQHGGTVFYGRRTTSRRAGVATGIYRITVSPAARFRWIDLDLGSPLL
jgi:hypothetical protein